uniref:Uncharacterized protein n=1 Tax=Kryptolebias marmoratus TaxID=37003 RepID=A0A3Q2ZTE2_KRYMA
MSAVKIALPHSQKDGSRQASKTMSAEVSPDSKCPICLDKFNNISHLDRCLSIDSEIFKTNTNLSFNLFNNPCDNGTTLKMFIYFYFSPFYIMLNNLDKGKLASINTTNI